MYLIIFIFGLIIGSFLTALTDRWPKEIPLSDGRSKCPKCNKQINWYDNIPLFSYIYLGGKCRNCSKKISIRYPLIEFSTAILFLLAYFNYLSITQNMPWINNTPDFVGFSIVLFLISIFIAVFVIDYEYQYIPDRLTFWGLGIFLSVLLITNNEDIYIYLRNGLLTSSFLLSLNLITKGKGMGLGDVKLAVLIGSLFTLQLSLLWMFASFVFGSIVGIAMLISKIAKVKQQIPFGPFLITSAIIVMFWGQILIGIALPYMF